MSLSSSTIFLTFRKIYNKNYATNEEFSRRKRIFMRNYNEIVRHNSGYMLGKFSYSQKIDADSDLTMEEWKDKMGIKPIPPIPIPPFPSR